MFGLSFKTMLGIGLMKRIGSIFYSDVPVFNPQKVLILTKLSRYEFEKKEHPELTDRELEKVLQSRGSDYNTLLYHHYIHKGVENTVNNALNTAGIETKVINRFNYTEANIEWADAIVTTGGDGTYLLAATRILNNKKPVIGFNSDPLRSKGHLCLPQKYSVEVKEAIDKLRKGKFKWTYRKRIRITLIGENIFDPPVELHNQKLQHPENRYLDMDLQLRTPKTVSNIIENSKLRTRILPVLVLNEVFIGECVSARVSYLELEFDGNTSIKQKCSGLIASTGTGSTSWTYSINKLTEQNLEEIVSIIKEDTGLPIRDTDSSFVTKITNKFNEMLIINSEEPRMVYTIRDMIHSSEYHAVKKPRGFAKTIGVKSRCFDAALVIDGGISYRFNDGTYATLEIREEDSLKTATLSEDQKEFSFKH